MATAEVVWAIHTFDAENPDEISFKAGEQVEVLERDDVFQDGWWTGKNVNGDTGLFPESYTSKVKPARAAAAVALSKSGGVSSQDNTVLQNTMSDVDHALKQHEQDSRRNSSDRRSIRSSRSRQSLKKRQSSASVNKLREDDGISLASVDSIAGEQDPAKARQALAARAKAQIDKAADLNREKERARQLEADKLNGIGAYGDYAMPIPGLELSDESDDDEDLSQRLSFPNSPGQPERFIGETPAQNGQKDLLGASISSVKANNEKSSNENTVATPTKRASITALFTQAMGNGSNNRSHSPTPSVSSRRSRRSIDPIIPPVPPVPVVDSPLPTQGAFDPSPRRSMSRRSSASSTRSRRSKSISVSPRPPSVPDTPVMPSTVDRSSLDAFRNPKALTVKVTDNAQTTSPLGTPKSGTADTSMPSSPGRASALRESLRSNRSPYQSSLETSVPDDAPFRSYAPPLATQMPEPIRDYPSPSQETPGNVDNLGKSANFASTPVSATSGSRPGSQLGYSTGGGGQQSIRTADTSPRSSVGTRTQDPRQWNVDQVVDWAKSKGFDALIIAKFVEHEISGDVLLDMDMNTLKEIDLTAFGRRVKVYNGIKELQRQIPQSANLQPANQFATPAVSPTMSGYEPDTPSTRANFSPRDTFSPAANLRASQAQTIASVDPPEGVSPFSAMPDVGPTDSAAHDAHLRGLGFDENAEENKKSSQMSRGNTVDDSVSPSKSNRSVNAHKRSHTEGTVGTYNTAYADSLTRVNEDEAEVLAERNAVTDSELVYSNNRVIPRKQFNDSQLSVSSKKDTVRKRMSWMNRDDNVDDTGRLSQRSSKVPGSAFFTTGFRARKPAPRVTSSMSEAEKSPRAPQSKRSTRLFGFGGSSSPVVGPAKISEPIESGRRDAGLAPPGADMERTASDERVDDWRDQHDGHQVASAPNALQQIGKPELDGYLRKRNEHYNSWKTRYIVVKNAHVYFMKNPKDTKLKGWIPIAGYKVVPDQEIARGYYGFKLVHPTLPWHYFSSDDPLVIRKFMKALMKSSIKRDEVALVYQSSNIPTIPLEEAQAMFPPPRPPSPESRDRAQKARLLDVNPNTLTAKDAQILMSLQKSPNLIASPSFSGPTAPPKSSKRDSKYAMLKGSSMRGKNARETSPGFPESASSTPRAIYETPRTSTISDRRPSAAESGRRPSNAESLLSSNAGQGTPRSQFVVRSEDAPLLQWVNSRLPQSSPPATSFTSSFRSGDLLYHLTKAVSGKNSRKLDTAKFSLVDLEKGDSFELADPVFDLFDWFLELQVDTVDTSIADILKGDEASTIRLVQSIKNKFQS